MPDMVQVTPKISVPRDRYIEWLQGTRPLPGQDAAFFFQHGLHPPEEAALLLRRHLALERAEAGEPEIPEEARQWLIERGWQPPAD